MPTVLSNPVAKATDAIDPVSDCSSSPASSSDWLKKDLTTSSSSKPSDDAFSCFAVVRRCLGKWFLGRLSEDITAKEGWLLGTIVLVNFLSFCAGSMLAPVLPQHLTGKMQQFGEEGAVSELDVSVAFVLYAGTSMVFSLVFGPLIPKFGINAFYYPGLLVVALTNIVLGLLDVLPIDTYRNYILAQCVIRVVEGIGAAAFNTSSHSIIMRVFSHHIDEAFAAVEAAVAISFSLGPVLGSFLVTSFGWFWAFCVFGIVVLLTMPVSYAVFSNYGSMESPSVSYRKESFIPLKIAASWNGIFVVISMLVTTTAYSFIEPTLELFLENVLENEYSIAFYFAQAAAFAISALGIAPFFARRSKLNTMIVGTFVLAIGFLIVGPCRYFFRNPNDHMTMAGVILIGFGFALAYVPTLDHLVETAVNDLGYEKGPSTYGPISGLWNFLNGFGETFGPVIAMFQTSPDFRDATVMLSTMLFSAAIMLMLISFVSKSGPRSGTLPEKTSLLNKANHTIIEVDIHRKYSQL